MSDNQLTWRDIPDEKEKEWDAVFEASRDGINLSQPCPVCGERSLHRYYHLNRRKEIVINGRRYIGHGGLWEWCSHCRCYLHATAAVPEEWRFPQLGMDDSRLTPIPELLEKAVARANRNRTTC